MEKTSGLHSLLASSSVYAISQKLMRDKPTYEAFLEHLLKRKNLNILDIGCGTANILEEIDAQRYVGFDISERYIEHSNSKHGIKPNHHFFVGEVSSDKLTGFEKFNVVLLKGVLHHLDDNYVKNVISIAHSHLSRSGLLLSIDPCLFEGQSIIARLLANLDRGKNVRNPREYARLISTKLNVINCDVWHQSFPPYDRCIIVGEKI